MQRQKENAQKQDRPDQTEAVRSLLQPRERHGAEASQVGAGCQAISRITEQRRLVGRDHI
jgi:hypothetical protein